MPEVTRCILIVDDDRNFCASVSRYLAAGNREVLTAHSAADCLALCAARSIDLVLLDQKLPDAEGADLCSTILERNSQTKIIFSTAFPSFENAVKAVRAGAFDYLAKPFELEELDLAVRQALRTLDLETVEQIQNYRNERERQEHVLVGSGDRITEIRRLIELAATAEATVLITGETGSGKNVAAHAIHDRGPLQRAPFIGINCAALPESLIEAELFGYEKGAFTGAAAAKKGLFEMAEGGTLFLDEIGELPMPLQAKLLGVLDDGTFRRLGGTAILRGRARIVAATGVDLEKAIKAGKFRQDLYYRLSVIKIHIPPLRDRPEDIPSLCDCLLARVAGGAKHRLAEGELDTLGRYHWPGNVRELRNVLERSVILQRGVDLRPSEFLRVIAPVSTDIGKEAKVQSGRSSTGSLQDLEREHILAAIAQNNGNHSAAARSIGISLSTLRRRLKQYRIG